MAGPDPPTDAPSVTPAALHTQLRAGERVRLLDVRDRDEFEEWHIDGPSVTASQVPLSKFIQASVTGDVDELVADLPGQGPITVVCGRGEGSAFVAGLLEDAGIKAQNLAEGMEGWAQLYVATELPSPTGTILQYDRPSSGCLSYLVVSDGEAAVIDPLRSFTDRYLADARDHGATLTYAIDTHVHADHVSGLDRLATGSDTEPVLPAAAVKRGVTFDVTALDPGESITVGSTTLRSVALPGHTTGMTGFRVGDILLAGDSVFLDSIARPDLETGTDGAAALAAELYVTLTERLADLPNETLVAPGHHATQTIPVENGSYTARLGELRERLPAFGMDRDSFVAWLRDDSPPQPANFERIIDINLGVAVVDDETAFELELGPNNCAATPADD
ncbi:MBL fold metallo-hydrolase [Haloarcula sp. GH36]|uniref:MBL fold metallo-hydrolase n=1 Tax=Haloarcula montana TaxID=3111776 RepID=UPI002D78718D|nr:MBL fold metallo-hydrolase [Haloarcula sp. GH36]